MSTQTNPPQYPNEKQQPVFPPQSAETPLSRPVRRERPIPEFLQRRHAEASLAPQTQQPSRPRPPRETVVPVLDEQTLTQPVQPQISEEAPGLSPYELDELEREITRAQARPRRSLAPEFMPPPPPPPLRSKRKVVAGEAMGGLVVRLVLVAAVAIIFILMYLGKIPLPASLKSAAAQPLKMFASFMRPAAPKPVPLVQAEPVKTILPQLVVEGADAGDNDEIGLGVRMTGPIEGVTAVVSGLAPGATLSRGQPWTDGSWFVPASELAMTKLRPAPGFSGTMQYTVALKMPDTKIADRQTLRLQWSQAKNREAQLRTLEADEISTMLSRGQTMLENGDIAGARLLLQRAAEGGNQEAAMALGASFDPAIMTKLDVRGVNADVEKARFWYEKAREFGSKEAPKRLESLASQSR